MAGTITTSVYSLKISVPAKSLSYTMVGFADGYIVSVKPIEEIFTVKVGHGGNLLVSPKESATASKLFVRLNRLSVDDINLHALTEQNLINKEVNFLEAEYVQQISDGMGNLKKETNILKNGLIQRRPDRGKNIDGSDVEQGVAVYEFYFSQHTMTIT